MVGRGVDGDEVILLPGHFFNILVGKKLFWCRLNSVNTMDCGAENLFSLVACFLRELWLIR